MIFGYRTQATIIVATNLPGYNDFTSEDFTKAFQNGETFEIFYPPDHPSVGVKYTHNSPQVESTIFGKVVIERSREDNFRENEYLNINKDFIYPLQTELTVRYYPSSNSGLYPTSDSNQVIANPTDYGIDAFLIRGSIIRGTVSGAKRYYAGPFKGFTKEIECVCEGATAVNNMDGADCRGWLKGSFYENGYMPSKHDLFNYAGEPRMRVDVNTPLNSDFMVPTPFGGLDYTWYGVHDRARRPVPYSMEYPYRNNNTIVITKKHVILCDDGPWGETLRFYSPSQGIITRTVVGGAILFENMWETIGFVDKNQTDAIYQKYLEMESYFGDGFTIATLSQDLPDDVVPVSLVDMETSDPIFFAMAIGQESRGHCGTFCPPLSKQTYAPINDVSLLFKQNNRCSYITDSVTHELPMTMETEKTSSVLRGDVGSPVVTYYHQLPVFLGWITGGGITYFTNSDYDRSFASISALGIGSTKEITFPWGAVWTPLSFLNAYLSKFGSYSATSISLVRNSTDTSETYPYPNTSFALTVAKTTTRKASVVNTDPRVGIKINESEPYRYGNKPYTLSQIVEDGRTQSSDFVG